MTATGEQFSTLAQTVREKAPEGKAGDVANMAADALDGSLISFASATNASAAALR